jgi:Cu(I)/Ag(I) efflux system membrane fusion protein
MTVRAPADGIVCYGRDPGSKRSTTATMGHKLQKGGNLTPDEVVMTIVAPRPLAIRAVVEEKNLHEVRAGLEGQAVAAGYPELKLRSRIGAIAPIPEAAGEFDARLDVDLGTGAETVMPGMACTVKLPIYSNPSALTVPATAVQTDEDDDAIHYVHSALGPDHAKIRVKTGKTGGGKTEILAGLNPGAEILAAKP